MKTQKRVTDPERVNQLLKDCGITVTPQQRAKVFRLMEDGQTNGIRVEVFERAHLEYFDLIAGVPVSRNGPVKTTA